MKGKIWLESEQGKGTTFHVEIPFRKTDRLVRPSTVLPRARGKTDFSPFHLLVVDDHPVNMLFARKLLANMGFTHITEATTGIEALDILRKRKYKFDLVLMDCQMPEMDGFEACRHLRIREAERSMPRLPVIAMTANAMEGDRDLCLAAGMDDYVSKPVNPDKLYDMLYRWLVKGGKGGPGHQNDEAATATAGSMDISFVELYTEGDLAAEKELIDVFAAIGRDCLRIMQSHLDGVATEQDWRGVAHKLKGAAAQIGAAGLSALALRAETDKALSLEDKKSLHSAIAGQFAATLDFFAERQASAA
jgi:CheY-like chemotaxis protein